MTTLFKDVLTSTITIFLIACAVNTCPFKSVSVRRTGCKRTERALCCSIWKPPLCLYRCHSSQLQNTENRASEIVKRSRNTKPVPNCFYQDQDWSPDIRFA
uniref:Secreted protein n=1 Tax=Anguilla anguilla TaxID=7936 RepID=A0A0E9X165_ANGAN